MQNSQANVWESPMVEVMEIPPYLDAASADYFAEDSRLCIESGARVMVLDASKLDYLTASGMRAMVAIAQNMQAAGGYLSIRNLKGQARTMFDACGFSVLIDDAGQVPPEARLTLVA